MSECHRQLVSWLPVRNWREWNLEQFQKSPSLRRVSMVGGTVFARLIGRPRAPPPHPIPFLPRFPVTPNDYRKVISRISTGTLRVLHDSMPLALFRAHLEIEPLPPCRENGVTEERDEERPTTRYPSPSPLPREGNRIAWPRSANIRNGLVGGV